VKLNELICPTCGLKCMTDAAYTTCDSCQTTFYASQSRSVQHWPMITITWPTSPYAYPTTVPSQPLQWVTVGDVPPCGGTASTEILTSDVDYQVWN
jgi:hypothetical protein